MDRLWTDPFAQFETCLCEDKPEHFFTSTWCPCYENMPCALLLQWSIFVSLCQCDNKIKRSFCNWNHHKNSNKTWWKFCCISRLQRTHEHRLRGHSRCHLLRRRMQNARVEEEYHRFWLVSPYLVFTSVSLWQACLQSGPVGIRWTQEQPPIQATSRWLPRILVKW